MGRLDALAVIRTFLDYLLGREVAEINERRAGRAEAEREGATACGGGPVSF